MSGWIERRHKSAGAGPQLASMRTLVLNGVLAVAALLLAGCSAYVAGDMGFAPSPLVSSVPRTHG